MPRRTVGSGIGPDPCTSGSSCASDLRATMSPLRLGCTAVAPSGGPSGGPAVRSLKSLLGGRVSRGSSNSSRWWNSFVRSPSDSSGNSSFLSRGACLHAHFHALFMHFRHFQALWTDFRRHLAQRKQPRMKISEPAVAVGLAVAVRWRGGVWRCSSHWHSWRCCSGGDCDRPMARLHRRRWRYFHCRRPKQIRPGCDGWVGSE